MKFDQTLVSQRFESSCVGLQRATTHLARKTHIGHPLGNLQQCGILLGRTARQSLKLLIQSLLRAHNLSQRHRSLGRNAEFVLGKLLVGHSARFHLRRQRGAHHLAHRTHIVVGNPLPQTSLLGRQQGLGIEYSLDRFGTERRSLRGDRPNDTRIDFSCTQLHHNCLTLTQMLRQLTLSREGERRLRQGQHDMCIEGHFIQNSHAAGGALIQHTSNKKAVQVTPNRS